MIYLPILGALAEGIGITIEKKILRKHKINPKNFIVYSFLAIILVMIPLIYFFWDIQPEAFQLKNILIFVFIILVSILANFFLFYGLKRETVTEIEPIRLMQPLFIILLALMVYPAERKLSFVILALIASITLVLSHVEKHHLKFDKYIRAALLGSFLFAVELVASKAILSYYSSITFYFIRCLFVFLITLVIFKPTFQLSKKTEILFLISGAIWVFYRIILYWGYVTLGVVFTTILFILAPIFVYAFAKIFLKEKIKLKQIISSIIIIACVVAAILLEN